MEYFRKPKCKIYWIRTPVIKLIKKKNTEQPKSTNYNINVNIATFIIFILHKLPIQEKTMNEKYLFTK